MFVQQRGRAILACDALNIDYNTFHDWCEKDKGFSIRLKRTEKLLKEELKGMALELGLSGKADIKDVTRLLSQLDGKYDPELRKVKASRRELPGAPVAPWDKPLRPVGVGPVRDPLRLPPGDNPDSEGNK